MRILVFGAGAIGSFLGHRLSCAGHDVTLILRAAQAEAIRSHGLRLHQGTDLQVSHPCVAEHIGDLGDERQWDCILLTIKAFDTSAAAAAVAARLTPTTPVIIVQNGVGGEELAAQHLPAQTLISGAITLSVSILESGCLSLETHRGGLGLAPVAENSEVPVLTGIFSAAGVRTRAYTDYRSLKWSKLLLNILGNAIPAIIGWPPGQVFSDPRLFGLERAAFLEAIQVMRAMNLKPVGLPGYPVPHLAWAMSALPALLLRPLLGRLVASGRGDKRPSLQMDLDAGRKRSEVVYLNGAVARHSQRLGLRTPVSQTITDVLMSIAEDRGLSLEFNNNPDRLIAAVQAQTGG